MADTVHIYSIAYNEEVLIEKMIRHYRDRFPNCAITIFDNQSSDKTREIAESLSCIVLEHDSNNEVRDDLYLAIKNNCWKGQNERWALICDVDEFLYLDENDLLTEQSQGSTVIQFEGWNLITMSDDPDIIDLDCKVGSRAPQYDKFYLFDTWALTDINYSAGCHHADPKGLVVKSDTKYLMCHWKALGLNYMINRHLEFGKRLSKQNRDKGWGVHYLDSAEQIRTNWKFYQEHPENKQIL
jgi:glycosyltransferase involved in cell wall biosynthesis